PYTRPASRAGRPGAPLWELVDFAPAVAAAERAGIEAALEGAGLLDAWVLPDGVVLDPDTLDVLLEPAPLESDGATLRDVVVVVDDPRVDRGVVERILSSVALADDAGAGTACAVSRTGHFRLGPTRGRFSKPAAEYVGAAARAERRHRRIAELDRQLAAIGARDDELSRALASVDGRLAALADESRSFPDTEPLASIRRRLAAAERREGEARDELAEREDASAAVDEQRVRARTVVTAHAESSGLPSDLDRAAVRARYTAAHRYQAGIEGAVQAAARRQEAAARLAELERRLDAARAAVAELVRRAELADAEARRLEAEHAEREAALGRTGEEIRARMHDLQETLKALRAEIAALEEADKDAAGGVIRLEGHVERAKEALATTAHERDAALGAFRRLGQSDLFALGLEADTPPGAASAADWTLTRALEILRSIPPQRLAVRSRVVELANRVQQQCGELGRSLAQQADMDVTPESDADGLLVVRVRQDARTLTVPELMRRLEAEIGERERTLSTEQRRIFNDTLLEEISEHLRERIERVTELVTDMNATLAHCPTGSGKTVQLEWAASEDGSGELRTVTRLLRRSAATLGGAERAPLIAFFRERIQRAREQAALGAGEAGAAAHLREAFDYRGWFSFTLYEVKDGQRAKLTAKRHALGSGGEQAVLIHMPLFAAASALYSSSRDGRAPRLVMLDEALSGIDDETREKVLGVLVALDLDVVMTSHELWGTYRTVPALSIYQLHRENGAFGVASEHFLWDGESLRELEQTSILE
ncbi:MAG: TIGR02680 family protein, partial [Gaiellaceae bacterium]